MFANHSKISAPVICKCFFLFLGGILTKPGVSDEERSFSQEAGMCVCVCLCVFVQESVIGAPTLPLSLPPSVPPTAQSASDHQLVAADIKPTVGQLIKASEHQPCTSKCSV